MVTVTDWCAGYYSSTETTQLFCKTSIFLSESCDASDHWPPILTVHNCC